MENKKTSFIVGLFVVAGLMILSFLILKLSDYGYARDSYEVRVLFNYANGVVVGAPVHLAGVEVGSVKDIYLDQEDDVHVELILNVFSDIIIRKDAVVKVNSIGLVGERYVDIFPQSKNAPIIQDGDMLIGEEPIPFSEMVSRIKELVTTVEDYLNKAVSKENRDKIDETIQNVHSISKNLSDVASKIDTLIAANEDKLSETITDFNDSSKALKSIVADNQEDINQAIKNIGASFEQFKQIVAYLDPPLEKLKTGEGTVGKLIHSDELYNHMNSLITDLEAHPWKLLKKSKSRRKKRRDDDDDF